MDDQSNIPDPASSEMVPSPQDAVADQTHAQDGEVHFDDLPDPPGLEAPQHNRRGSDPRPGSFDAVLDVSVRVQAILGRARMPIAELVAMRPGYVVELDRRVGEPIEILVNNRPIARGEIVMIDGSLGVTLTEIVKQES